MIRDYLQGADLSTIPTLRPKLIIQAKEVLVSSWSVEFRVIARVNTDTVPSLNEIMNLWDTNRTTFNGRRGCVFDSINLLLYHQKFRADNADVMKRAMEIVGDIMRNSEIRHACARLTFNPLTIIRGFLTHLRGGEFMQLQDYF